MTDTKTETMTEAQRDGRACVGCGGEGGPMRPAGELDGGQVFAHAACVEPDATRAPLTLLLVPMRDRGWRARLTSAGRTVTYETPHDASTAADGALSAWLDATEDAESAALLAASLGADREHLAARAAAVGLTLRHIKGAIGEADGEMLTIDFRRYSPAECRRRVEALLERAEREGCSGVLRYREDARPGAEAIGGAL